MEGDDGRSHGGILKAQPYLHRKGRTEEELLHYAFGR